MLELFRDYHDALRDLFMGPSHLCLANIVSQPFLNGSVKKGVRYAVYCSRILLS